MTDYPPVPELYVSSDAAAALGAEANRLPAWTLDARQEGELALLLSGGFAPLRGYMTESDWRAVSGGAAFPWPVPLALQVDAGFAGGIRPGDDIALRDAGGAVLAVLSVTDRWGDPVLLGGRIKGLRRPDGAAPNDLRRMLRDRGAPRVLAILPRDGGQIPPAAALARRMDAALLILAAPGVNVDPPAGALVAPLPVPPPEGPAGALWQGLVARNHGATDVVLDGDGAAIDLFRLHQDALGVRMAVPDKMA